jgi:Zn-dependent protease with chaperone function
MTPGAFISLAVFQFIIPFIFTVLFVVFAWGMFYYVIAGGHDEEAREKGKALLLYGLIGFLILTLFWSFSNFIGAMFSR